ncbi:MAG: T9SS type A sorting domain-containing protein [Flavobacteriales bacterium]|nr:T9SS type A sorting domain-containing protein [Flavobacteriales bacterium]MCA0390701.1 T9SS type A sorting domain-containing protein [Bacteroidota bacterium]
MLLQLFYTNTLKAQVRTAYTFAQTNGTYAPITGGSETICTANAYSNTGLDDVVKSYTFFDFYYDGAIYNQVNISSNGFITLGTTAPATNNYAPLSDAATYSGAISAWGRDINGIYNLGSRTSVMSVGVLNTAPNRILVCQWKDFRQTNGTGTSSVPYVNFQIRLYEATGNIQVIYGASGYAVGSTNAAGSAQVGLRGPNNTFATNVNNRTNTTGQLYSSSTAGTANNSVQNFASTTSPPGVPASGLTYTWTTCVSLTTNPNVDTITKNSARFYWTAASPAPASGYDIYYSTSATAPTAGTTPTANVGAGVTQYTTPATLTPNTVYYYWVRSKCGGSSSGVWKSGGYFNTLPNYDCLHGDGQIKGTVEDGLNVQIGTAYRAADDIIVPAGKVLTVRQITLEALAGNTINSAVINIRANNAGLPGAVVSTVTMAPSSSSLYTTAFGFNVYHLTFNLATPVALNAGKYWLEVTMSRTGSGVVYWRAMPTDINSYGSIARTSSNSGSTWQPNTNGYNMVYFVAGDCTDDLVCAPVLASADKYAVCTGEAVTLSASSSTGGYTYTWYTDWDNDTHSGTLVGTGTSVVINPTESTLYGVVATKTGCPTGVNAQYQLISIAVTPTPTLMVLDPIEAITCSNELREINVVSGGNIPNEALDENFDPIKNPWITSSDAGVAGQWSLWQSNGTIASPDNSDYAMTGSYWAENADLMNSSLISAPISLLDYNTPINLTFNHLFWTDSGSKAYVRISTDRGDTWSTLKTYSADVGGLTSFASETINLDAYAGNPFILLSFDYLSLPDEWFWAIDDIKVTGGPKPTTITWSPTTDLYMDSAGNIPYSGQNTATVYASPSVSTTYTASATTAVGCPASATVTIERGDKDWTASTGNWNSAATWSPAGIPTINHCVKIPTGKTVTVNIPDAKAKNITIKSGGKLEIAGNLTVEEKVVNENTGTGAADQFVLLSSTENSNANYLQNSNTPNTSADGVMRAERRVTDMDNVLSGTNAQMDYVYWSAPVAGQDLQAFSPGTPANRIYQYNEPTDLFVKATGNFVPAKGYAIRAETGKPDTPLPSYDKTYNFRGIANNGDIPISIQRTNSSGTTGIGYNLVGNPYPSNIDFDELYYGNSSLIYNTAWFWTNNSYEEHQQGSSYGGNNYAVYNGTGGNAPTTPSGQPAYPDGIIKVGQGFIVQKKTVGSGSLEFKNSYGSGHNLRVTSDGTFFHKGNTPKNRFWIKLIAPEGLVNTQLIGYIPGATDGYEQDFDAQAMSLSSDLFYSVLDDKKLVIQGKSDNFNIEDKIPIGANIFKNGNYTIALDKAEGIFETDQSIYLKDNLLETVTNLNEQDYTFDATAGITEDRFEIIYQPENVLATGTADKYALEVYRDGGDFIVRSSQKRIAALEVYDASGRMVYSTNPFRKETVIPGDLLVNGIYLVKTELEDGQRSVKKIRK